MISDRDVWAAALAHGEALQGKRDAARLRNEKRLAELTQK
jgi:hypothetical protein